MGSTRSKRELIVRELDQLGEQDPDRLLGFMQLIKESRAESVTPVLAAETALLKDWMTPDEDAAWAYL